MDQRFYLGSDSPLDPTCEANDESVGDSIDIFKVDLWEINCF